MISKVHFHQVGEDAFARNPSGTGPFRLKRWISDDRLILEKNLSYHENGADGKPLPYLVKRTVLTVTAARVTIASHCGPARPPGEARDLLVLVFTIRRLIQAVPVVFISTVAVFLLLHLVPGDPAIAIAGSDARPDTIAAIRKDLGLDEPLPVQYALWMGRVLRGDLGVSYASKISVADQIAQRIPATLELTLAGLGLAILISIPTGVVAAVRERSFADWLVSSFNAFAIAVPNFWFGILMILLFGLALGWLPPSGRGDLTRDPGTALTFLILPALTLALNQSAVLSRFVKSSMLEVMHEDFVRTARSKGLREWLVIQRHVLRNALVPVATVLGIQFGRLLGGAIVVESVFAWPGLGRLILQGIGNRDYAIVQGVLLLLVVTFVFVNLIVDLAYGLLDPRIRLSRGVGR